MASAPMDLELTQIDWPQLFDRQAEVFADNSWRLTFVSGGQKCGLSAMARHLAVAVGAERGQRVALLAEDADAMFYHRQSLLRTLEPALLRAPTASRLLIKRWIQTGDKIGNFTPAPGGVIDLGHLGAARVDLTERVDVIIVDCASRVPGFLDMWDTQLLPLVRRWNCQVWVFGHPAGTAGGFGRAAVQAEAMLGKLRDQATGKIISETAPLGRIIYVPTEANDMAAVDLQDLRDRLPPEEFQQEYEGRLFDKKIELTAAQQIIGDKETFVAWCERLAADGLEVDGFAFRLDDRPTMRWIYEQIPSTIEEAYEKLLIIMKCSQVGFTVMEMLAVIYMALKFAPAKVGMFLPQQTLATVKSSQRFMPIVRTVPDAHRLMTENPSGTRGGEGNVLTRNMGRSVFYFLWTTGKATTESLPMDILSFDEVQEMAIADMEKTQERLSASRIKYTLMGSTANWPDRDIHFFYKQGQGWRFWTLCESCGEHQVLDDHFPACIRLREGVDVVKGKEVTKTDYRYVCHQCDAVIPDSQNGEWRPDAPDARHMSIHYPQFLSPTISPRNIIEAYHNADDMKNFYNRKLGKPFTDPSQVPVTLDILNRCARIGMEMGLQWENRGSNYFMGLDQGGLFNVAIIAKRLPTGHMGVVHVEEMYGDDPFARCSELMDLFNISVCVVESLPNYNDAKRFAGRHKGKVFLASYTQMKDGMIAWGDAVPNKQERKTEEEDRDRYTVTLDQYKCMQVALNRITKEVCVFPDPDGLLQKVKIKERSVIEELMPILKDRVFLHLTRVALVAELDEEERKYKRRVVKVGIDPHFAYAYMLLNVAWARSHGTTMFLTAFETAKESEVQAAVKEAMPGLPAPVLGMLDTPDGVCGACSEFDPESGLCSARRLLVRDRDPACDMFNEGEE